MRNTLAGVDRFGNYVLGSQVYTNARDLARLGMLYLNEGVWNGKRLLPREWLDYVGTPACATRDFGNFYSTRSGSPPPNPPGPSAPTSDGQDTM